MGVFHEDEFMSQRFTKLLTMNTLNKKEKKLPLKLSMYLNGFANCHIKKCIFKNY